MSKKHFLFLFYGNNLMLDTLLLVQIVTNYIFRV